MKYAFKTSNCSSSSTIKLQLQQNNKREQKLNGVYETLSYTLQKKRFALNFLIGQNISKFAILIEKENTRSILRFSFLATLCFTQVLPYQCPDLCRHRPGHS